jgi:hypothetical protein
MKRVNINGTTAPHNEKKATSTVGIRNPRING